MKSELVVRTNLKDIRTKKKLSQQELADLVGVSRNRARINENVTDRGTRGYEFSDPRTDNDMGIYKY